MRNIPDFSQYYASDYDDKIYKKRGLINYCMDKSHIMLEAPFTDKDFFDKVLEIGSGLGVHLKYINHRYNTYTMADLDDMVIKKLELKNYPENIIIKKLEGEGLPFPDNYFDRLIASHVLEHIHHPEIALREWNRVVKNCGIISIALPCDPGLAWRFGRIFSRKDSIKRGFIEYDLFMALEHINPINNLISIIEYFFENKKIQYWPFKIKITDINLFYIANIVVEK